MDVENQFGLNDSADIKQELDEYEFYESQNDIITNDPHHKKTLNTNFDSLDIAKNLFDVNLSDRADSVIEHGFESENKPFSSQPDSFSLGPSQDDCQQTPSIGSLLNDYLFPAHSPTFNLQTSANGWAKTNQTTTNLFAKASKFMPSESNLHGDSSENLFMRGIYENYNTSANQCLEPRLDNQNSEPSAGQNQTPEMSQPIPFGMHGQMFVNSSKKFGSHFTEQKYAHTSQYQDTDESSSFTLNSSQLLDRSYNHTDNPYGSRTNLFQLASSNEHKSLRPDFMPEDDKNIPNERNQRMDSHESQLSNLISEQEVKRKEIVTNNCGSSFSGTKKLPIKPIFKPVFKKPKRVIENNLNENNEFKVDSRKKINQPVNSQVGNNDSVPEINFILPSHETDNTSESEISQENTLSQGHEVVKDAVTSIQTKDVLTNHSVLPSKQRKSNVCKGNKKLPKVQSSLANKQSGDCDGRGKSLLKQVENFKTKFPSLFSQTKKDKNKPLVPSSTQKNESLSDKKKLLKVAKTTDHLGHKHITKTNNAPMKESDNGSKNNTFVLNNDSPKQNLFTNSENKVISLSKNNSCITSKLNSIPNSDCQEVPEQKLPTSPALYQLSPNTSNIDSDTILVSDKQQSVLENNCADAEKGLSSESTRTESFRVIHNLVQKKTSLKNQKLKTQKRKGDDDPAKYRKQKTTKQSLGDHGSPRMPSRKLKTTKKRTISAQDSKIKDARINSLKERLYKLQNETNFPVWVQCEDCRKWRCLEDVQDPSTLPSKWTCSLNSDAKIASCDVEEVLEAHDNEEAFVFNRYTLGSVVWVTSFSPRWWPAMVDDDPETETFFWLPETSNVPNFYHVTFFGPDVSRAWIRSNSAVPFSGRQERIKASTKREDEALKVAVNEAKLALTMPLEDRRRIYCFATRFKGNWFPTSSSQVSDEDSEVQATSADT